MDLIALFLAAFLAATIIPAQSEALLTAMHLTASHSATMLVSVATSGNVLGSCVNWILGRYIERLRHQRWFPMSEAQLDRAARLYNRFGIWTLLFAWVPIIGDPLTVIAGVLRVRFVPFVILVTIGKLGRYLAIVAAV